MYRSNLYYKKRVLSFYTTVYTELSEKNGTFICELILERYVYMLKTQNQLKITSYGPYNSFIEFYPAYNGVCWIDTSGIMNIEVRRFLSICTAMGGSFCIETFGFTYLLLRFCLLFIYWQDAPHQLITLRNWQLPSIYTFKEHRHPWRTKTIYNYC